jgi:4-hydroxyproline epimerase
VGVVDSHTGGEPTRVVVSGIPALRGETLARRREDFASRFAAWRRGVIEEPRGGDAWVGALLLEACDPSCDAAVIFFNNAGCLNMCGHGLMGLVVTLGHLGRVRPGARRIETPAGVVTATLEGRNTVVLENVPSFRLAKDVEVELPGRPAVRGDVAWGGNWFFLVHDHGMEIALSNVAALTAFAAEARRAVNVRFPEVDHIELLRADGRGGGRSFVLCPGSAYDRSPCGTGTSATMACRFLDGELAAGEVWRQVGITGSVFEGSVRPAGKAEGAVIPTLRGEAFVTGEGVLVFDPSDPFCWGIG